MSLYFWIVLGIILLLIMIGLAIVNYSTDEFIARYDEYKKYSCGNTTTEELVYYVSRCLGSNIKITTTPIPYGDCYNPTRNIIALSNNSLHSNSLSALTVTAHELGHAQQNHENPQKMRNYFRKLKIFNFIGKLFFPSIIIFILSAFLLPEEYKIYSLIFIGISLLTTFVTLILKLSTIKIEKEASDNALKILEEFADFNNEQLRLSKILLNSAKNTYVAEFLKTLLKWTMLTRR